MKPEQELNYTIYQNKKGQLLFVIRDRGAPPANPFLVDDGGEHALLYRQEEGTILLDFLHPEAHVPLGRLPHVLIAERNAQGEYVREYAVPVKIVKALPLRPEHIPVL